MSEKVALVKMEVCKLDVALTLAQAEAWAAENGFMPDKVSCATEYLYCYAIAFNNLISLEPQGVIAVGSKVQNNEPQCPMDGCTSRYENQQGVVVAIFADWDTALDAMYNDPTAPQTEYWFTNIYQ